MHERDPSPMQAHLSTQHRQLRTTIAVTWILAVALIALTWWHAGTQIRDARERELTAAARDLGNLTRLTQEHADRTLHSADQVLRFVQARYIEMGERLDLIRLTQQGIIDAENFPQVGIIDPQGLYILANRPITGRLDLSDREHFRVHVPPGHDGLFVSKPVLGRATGKWSIQLTRRINLPDGSFGGVAVLSVDPGYFTRFYSDLRLGEDGVATLVGLDGIARARQSRGKAEFGQDLNQSPLIRLLNDGSEDGFLTSRSPVDGVERMLSYRRLQRFPLAVVVGFGVDEVLANYRRTRDVLVTQAAIACALVVALGLTVTRHLIRLRRELEKRLAAQQQVLERNEQINAIFALSPDGFVAFGDDDRIRYVNPAFVRMTGATEAALEGMDEKTFGEWLSSLCDPAASYAALAAPARQRRQRPGDRDTIVIAAARRVLQVRCSAGQPGALSRILYFRDVTREAEVDQIKSEFLSTAAHELRTPMASIYGFAEVLVTTEVSDEERVEFQNIIRDQSGNMARILDELLDLARMEERRGKDFKFASLDLGELAGDVIRSFKPPADRSPPEFVRAPDRKPVSADAGKLRQALLNVLSNAYKYSPDGGPVGVMLVERQHQGQHQVGLRVQDRGIGMTPAQLERVFERFYRADKSGQLPGTGLGMSIVKEIVELHQGTVDVSSVFGQGTTVELWFPAEAGPSAEPRQ